MHQRKSNQGEGEVILTETMESNRFSVDPQRQASISSESHCSIDTTETVKYKYDDQSMCTPSLVHLSPSTVEPQHVDSCPEHKSILPLTLDHQRIASTLPQPMDIICGRGSRVSSNPGNHRFRIIVEQQKVEYQCAVRREEKSRITMEVIHQLTQGPRPSRCV